MLSLGNAGFPIGNRSIPLSLDPLIEMSLSLGLNGLTDTAGKAMPSIPLPNNPVLVGLGVYAGAVTLDPAQPFAIGHIANEHFFELQP